MINTTLQIIKKESEITLYFRGELTLYTLQKNYKNIKKMDMSSIKKIDINLEEVNSIDTAVAIFLNNIYKDFITSKIETQFLIRNNDILKTLELVKIDKENLSSQKKVEHKTIFYRIGEYIDNSFSGFLLFIAFLGNVFFTKLHYLKSIKNIRFKEIAFEINESGIKALGIISLTSFLIGLVIAYQSAFQLKLYGANIFIVDMIGISILRELAPLITAIVIAGRSGSAFTAQIGAMKITEELDAMRTMGFDPYIFLVMPRIIALMITLPLLIFVADIMGIFGGMLVANLDLNITVELFLDRFHEVVNISHFFIGLLKGPFFAFLIASISIYRGMMVKNDTQSIGFNTTKSVVEAIFAVILCDAIFSIVFTSLGI